ncbi:MAG TPA: sugar phosphate nucleotidyltransferase [Candidatus Kapabacteria bacterium]|nr:sugar phosphate nucleotidyltransferase [Candidatus Kapabacteria bacterium]
MSEGRPLAAVIMAAGKGTRMNNPAMAKVMFPIGGVPMIDHVVARALEQGAERVIVVIGHNREAVRAHLAGTFGDAVAFAEQTEQLGTGHAVMQAVPALEGFQGDVLVLSGDVPLLGSGTLSGLRREHVGSGGVATVLTVIAPDPTGYGRIIRNDRGMVERIVEHRDATEEERSVAEINSGIYIFRAADLLEALAHLGNDNAQHEYYLTDVFGWFRDRQRAVAAYATDDFGEVQGINTVEQLARVDHEFAARSAIS